MLNCLLEQNDDGGSSTTVDANCLLGFKLESGIPFNWSNSKLTAQP
jgi:hypothetical protein